MDDKDVWPLPKSASYVQFVGMVEELINQKMSGKSWNHARQEALATAMRNRSLTNGRNMSGQRVRTLFANGPKFLGLAFTDEPEGKSTSPRVMVTEAGQALAKEGLLTNQSAQSLTEWVSSVGRIDSKIISLQLMKLWLNNPVTSSRGRFLISPFRLVMRLCLELGWVDKEELAYIVFNYSDENDYELLVQRIKNFRLLSHEARDSEIEAYKKTDAGRITLVKAPTSNYFLTLCKGIPGFVVDTKTEGQRKIKIVKVVDEAKAKTELAKFEGAKPYDFGERLGLWIEYFGDPDKINPPFDATIDVRLGNISECFVQIRRNEGKPEFVNVTQDSPELMVPVFEGDNLEIQFFSPQGQLLKTENIESVKSLHSRIAIDLNATNDGVLDVHEESYEQCLLEIGAKGWDTFFLQKLELIKQITGSDLKDNRTKGGRLEEVAYGFLSEKAGDGSIDRATWYGKKDSARYGLPSPAPGGVNGNPDLVVELDEYSVVLELTTIVGTAAQWKSSEAASVPDHIVTYARQNPNRKVVGFFIAPSINNRIRANFHSQSKIYQVPIVCLRIDEFVDLFSMSKSKLSKKLEHYMSLN